MRIGWDIGNAPGAGNILQEAQNKQDTRDGDILGGEDKMTHRQKPTSAAARALPGSAGRAPGKSHLSCNSLCMDIIMRDCVALAV